MPTVIIDIDKTTFVTSAQSDSSFSNSPQIYTGMDPFLNHCISFLQISFPNLPVEQVNHAALQLVAIVKSGEKSSPICAHAVTELFDLQKVTYRTRPAFTAAVSQVNVRPRDLYTTVKIDVTGLVNSWLDGSAPNYGIALTNSDGVSVVQFTNDKTFYVPKLILNYSDLL